MTNCLNYGARMEGVERVNRMGDSISRQAAIELIRSLYPSPPIMRMNRKRWKEKYNIYIELEKALEMMPSAEPETKLIAEVKISKEDIQSACDEAVARIMAESERKRGFN